jgi:hypothetical protein
MRLFKDDYGPGILDNLEASDGYFEYFDDSDKFHIFSKKDGHKFINDNSKKGNNIRKLEDKTL